MSQNSSPRPRPRRQLSKAEIKAYEARRLDELRRIGPAAGANATSLPTSARRSYTLSRDEEFAIIRSDLRRMLIILACLVAIVVVLTLFLR